MIKGTETQNELSREMYDGANGVKPNEPHFARLARVFVRVGQRQTEKLREHRNAHEGDEEYEPPSAAEEDAWQSNDEIMKDAFSRLDGELEALYALKKMNATTATGAYTAAALAQQKRLRHGVIEELNCILRKGLLAATRNVTLLSHLGNKGYVRTEIDNLDQITAESCKRIVCLTSVRLMVDIFNTMSKRGGANNQVLTTLFKPPNPIVRSKLACASSNKLSLLSRPISAEAGVEVEERRVEQPVEVGVVEEHRPRTTSVSPAVRRDACPRRAQRATKKRSARWLSVELSVRLQTRRKRPAALGRGPLT